MMKPLFHISVFLLCSSVMYYDQTYVKWELPNKDMEQLPLKSRSIFLTSWCMIVQTIYHFIAFLNDIIGTNELSPRKPPTIRKIKDSLFVLAFSSAIYVTIGFWSVNAIGRELIIPKFVDKIYPAFVNHIAHTSFSIFIIIELLTSHIQFPSRIIGYTIILIFYLCYVAWFFGIYARFGLWVYPVFIFINWPLRVLMTAISLGIAVVIYTIGEKVNKAIYSELSLKESLVNDKDKSVNNKINGDDDASIMNGDVKGVNGIANGVNTLNRTNGATNQIDIITKTPHEVLYKINNVTDVINYFNSKINDNVNKDKKGVSSNYNTVINRNSGAVKDINHFITSGTNGVASKINSVPYRINKLASKAGINDKNKTL